MPIVVFIVWSLITPGTIEVALVAILAGNAATVLFCIRSLALRTIWSRQGFGTSVGIINACLWVVAGFDKIAFEVSVPALMAASYALHYGLLDKGFRSVSQALTTSSLGDAFRGTSGIVSAKFYMVTALLWFLSLPCAYFAGQIISGSRYSLDFLSIGLISLGLLFMVWATPHYLKILGSGSLRGTLLFSLVMVAICVAMTVLLIPVIGHLAGALATAVAYGMWFMWCVHGSSRRCELAKQ